ncbi:hypothetical protein [Rhodoferax antarcticus]|uniref:Uncharacterized protein n=1 Tax=Rhodoferax antarcticus ANT.BR TaxID=1111071 RepID=A0A1Q8Y959_9BURK|nr:hypothetical protein [Rhodoferax antarcticus]OLP04533.1 hypothetical protein BLL52_4133 [Rhodoferax antarcticus ANT.BR]
MYNEILFFPESLRGQQIYPDVARKMLAAACDGLAIHPGIFNRDEAGKLITSHYGHQNDGEGFGVPPKIVFDGGTGFIRIFGLGKSGVDLLNDNSHILMAAMRKHCGGAFRMEMKHGDMTLAASEPIMYGIRRLVVEKNAKAAGHYFHVQAVEREEEIKKVILTGLISCARYLDDESKGESHFESHIPSEDSLILDILEGDATPIDIKPGIRAAGFKNVTFCTNLDLSGPWCTGKLRSRGYGIIRKRIA